MKEKLKLGKVLILFGAGLIFAFGGLYFDKILLSLGIYVIFLAGIFLTIINTDTVNEDIKAEPKEEPKEEDIKEDIREEEE